MTDPLADAALTAFIADFNALQLPPASETGAAAMRAAAEGRAAARPKGPEMHAVQNVSVPPLGCPARLYRPTASASALVLYLHGGGWVTAISRRTTVRVAGSPPVPARQYWRSTTAARRNIPGPPRSTTRLPRCGGSRRSRRSSR